MFKHNLFTCLLMMAATAMAVSSCYAVRAYRFRKFNLTDHEKLPSTTISAGTLTFDYAEGVAGTNPRLASWLDSNLQQSQTAAFLVVRNDSVIYERYTAPYNRQSLLPSFSVAKSFVGTLVGIALEQGKINSPGDPITRYIPELKKKDKRFEAITIQHLLDMRSGIKWNEGDYGLKDDAIKLGFRPNMMKQVLRLQTETEPGVTTNYQSINTLLLAIALERCTSMSLPAYLQQQMWHPMGMESRATWNKDKRGLTIAYGTLNATARDFAKLGTLYLNGGSINGRQIVAPGWIHNTVSADSMTAYSNYRNQWWGVTEYKTFQDTAEAVRFAASQSSSPKVIGYTDKSGNKRWYMKTPTNDFYAQGILGQLVYVCPAKKLVIVRLGHNWSHPGLYLMGLVKELRDRL